MGKTKKEKKVHNKPRVKQFKLRFDDGREIISSLENLPANFKGIILDELKDEEYFQQDLLDEFEILWNVAKIEGKKPFWCFHRLAEYCHKKKVAFPSDAMLGKMAKEVGYGQGFIIKAFSDIIKKYNLN